MRIIFLAEGTVKKRVKLLEKGQFLVKYRNCCFERKKVRNGVDLGNKLVRMENGTPLAFRSNFSWLVVYGWNPRLVKSLGDGPQEHGLFDIF